MGSEPVAVLHVSGMGCLVLRLMLPADQSRVAAVAAAAEGVVPARRSTAAPADQPLPHQLSSLPNLAPTAAIEQGDTCPNDSTKVLLVYAASIHAETHSSNMHSSDTTNTARIQPAALQ